MVLSAFNIISKIADSNSFYIVNLLSGNADIIEENELDDLLKERASNSLFQEKGYLVDADQEKVLFKQKYLDYLDQREKEEIQIFFVPTYQCNFACSYCYQVGYTHTGLLTQEVIDAFFTYTLKYFSGKKYYITLFGGEPLLLGKNYQPLLQYFFQRINDLGIELAIVTNGYHILEYIDLIKSAIIREVQVTLDGLEQMHNNRRYLHQQKPTFNKIVEGIDALLNLAIPVNLRLVLDKENIQELPKIAQFAIDKGWTSHEKFKTQLGRNYELHYHADACQSVFSRIEMHQAIYQLIKQYPHIIEFHQPAFSISRFLFENESLPEPLFDACPACKTEWAFDYTGAIYSCTATVGHIEDKLGTFYPEVQLNQALVDQWAERDILSIEKCKTCDVNLACGGGCGSIAKNQSGKINAPDCRPIKDLIAMGIAYYNNVFTKI